MLKNFIKNVLWYSSEHTLWNNSPFFYRVVDNITKIVFNCAVFFQFSHHHWLLFRPICFGVFFHPFFFNFSIFKIYLTLSFLSWCFDEFRSLAEYFFLLQPTHFLYIYTNLYTKQTGIQLTSFTTLFAFLNAFPLSQSTVILLDHVFFS